MKVPLKADVFSKGGLYGKVIKLIIHPVKEIVTHSVIRSKETHKEHLVPVDIFESTGDNVVAIALEPEEIDKFPDFIEHEFLSVEGKHPSLNFWSGEFFAANSYYYSPYVVHNGERCIEVEREQIPEGEIAVKKGLHVFDKNDHKIGSVDELMIDEESDHITHLILRKGHLWGAKDVSVPASKINKITDDGVYLELEKEEVKGLPEFVIKRYWE